MIQSGYKQLTNIRASASKSISQAASLKGSVMENQRFASEMRAVMLYRTLVYRGGSEPGLM